METFEQLIERLIQYKELPYAFRGQNFQLRICNQEGKISSTYPSVDIETYVSFVQKKYFFLLLLPKQNSKEFIDY